MEWHAMLLLGAYHGINPAMGWLFAVALGLQQGSARGVWRALPPLALGHAVAVGVVLIAAALARLVLPLSFLRPAIAGVLLALGLYRMWRHRHPRFGGMQVGSADLVMWSFLMASAHGAGVMILPFVPALSHDAHAASSDVAMDALTNAAMVHSAHASVGAWQGNGAVLVAVHTLAYFAVMASTAWIVYGKLGLALLRTAWLNLDLIWAAALVVAGIGVLLT